MLVVGGLIVLIGGIVALAVSLSGGGPPRALSTTTTSTPATTTTAPATSTSNSSSSSTTSTSSTTTSTSTTTTTTTTTTPTNVVSPSSVLVQVVNGFGGQDAATQAANALHSVGFPINGTGDANSFTYGASVVQYAPGNLGGAETVAAHIEGTTTLQEVNDLPASDEVVLILGSTYRGIAS